MAIEFKLPDIGEGLADGEIIKWLVSAGEQVEEDQPLVEVLTDKATVEIPCPHDGRVLKLCASEGDVVAIGATILLFGEADEELAEEPAEDSAAAAPEEIVAAAPEEILAAPVEEIVAAPVIEGGSVQIPDDRVVQASEDIEMARELARAERSAVEAEIIDDEVPASLVNDEVPAAIPAPVDGRILATPATRRLANELGIDIASVPGSGRNGRVMKEDIRAFAEGGLPEAAVKEVVEAPQDRSWPAPDAVERPHVDEKPVLPPPTVAEEPVVAEPVAVAPVIEEPTVEAPSAPPPAMATSAASGEEERIPLRGLRRTISQRMVAAKQTAPHYTYVEEADMEEVVHLRAEAKSMAAEHGVKLTYLPFIVRALTMALKKHPYLNASLDEEAGEVVLKSYYNIGIAAATEGGLIVPVIKNADALGLFELAAEIQRISTAARDGSIALEDLQGGTFTVTSTGNIGGLIATPILNLPEVAILGVTAIRKRPVVRDDQIVIRHMVNLSLTLDHRVVDGAVGALFMRDLVRLLEDPKLQLIANL